MYTIGEFAAFGRVSARMLRHYDSIGLLVPARIDAGSGYRRYEIAQLPRLLRIAELRNLGIGLDEIAAAFDPVSGEDALQDVLVARHAELTASIAADRGRLQRIEQLRAIEGDQAMNEAVRYRPVDQVTVYATSGLAQGAGPGNVGPVVGTIITRLDEALHRAGRPLIEPGIFWYEPVHGSDDLAVYVSYVAEERPVAGAGYDIVTLPATETMATLIHRGDMTGIDVSWSNLMRRVVDDGYRMTGPCREVSLEADGHEPGPEWVTELQVPVAKV